MTQGNDFLQQQQRAIERMQEMNRRANMNNMPHTMPPSPPFVKMTGSNFNNRPEVNSANNMSHKTHTDKEEKTDKNNNTSGDFPLSSVLGITDRLKAEPDMALVLGLLLILWSEGSDRWLLLALIYTLF